MVDGRARFLFAVENPQSAIETLFAQGAELGIEIGERIRTHPGILEQRGGPERLHAGAREHPIEAWASSG